MFYLNPKFKLLLCMAVLLLCISAGHVSAQATFWGNTSPMNPPLLKVVPSIRGGHQHIGLNFNMPANLLPGSLLIDIPANSDSSIDFKLRNADVWLGAVRLDVETAQRWSFFLSGETSLKRNITAVTDVNPMYGNLGLNRPVEWNGSGFHYWTLDAGGGFRFRNDWKAIAGLRYDRITVSLDTGGGDLSSILPPVAPPYVNQLLSSGGFGDFQQNLWIPYAGVELIASNYTWNLIGSPFVATELKLPLSAVTYLFSGGIFGGLVNGYEQNRQITYNYKVTKPSVFLESNFEYTMNPGSTLALVGWLKGSWLHFRGHGSLDASTYVADDYIRNIPAPPPPFTGIRTQSASSSDSGTAEFNRYILALGIATQLTF